MDMRTDVTAVPHAGLGYHFLRRPVRNHRILGVCKRKWGQKRKIENDDQVEVTACRACLQNLKLNSANLKIKQVRQSGQP